MYERARHIVLAGNETSFTNVRADLVFVRTGISVQQHM